MLLILFAFQSHPVAGLVTAAGSAGVGAKVAIIEMHLLGGDCLNVGCVPSKALLRCARTVHELKVRNRVIIAANEISYFHNCLYRYIPL